MTSLHRRQFIKQAGFSAAVLPFIVGLPSLGLAAPARPRQRLIILFTPNGTIPPAFWPDEVGRDFKLKDILSPLEPHRERYVTVMRNALTVALALLAAKDRLRLACYYAQELTLAQIGRTLGEHEATVSRQLSKARKAVRADVEQQLREAGLNDAGVAECFAAVAADPGPLDLTDLLEPAGSKNHPASRSR